MIEEDKFNYTETKRKKFSLMPCLDFYILREYLIPLCAIFLLFSMLLLLGELFDDLRDFLEMNASFKTIVQYFTYRLPRGISLVMPIATILACMYTMANFGKNNEVVAMRASGVSLRRCGGAIYIVAIIISIINFVFNEKIVSDAYYAAEDLKHEVQNPGITKLKYKVLTYRSEDRRRTWFFNFFNKDGVQKSTILKRFDHKGKIISELTAEEAEYIPKKGWEFRNLSIIDYKNNSLFGSDKKFDKYFIGKDEIIESPEDILNTVIPPKHLSSMTIHKLLSENKDMSKHSRNILSTIFWYRLTFPWSCFLVVLLGIPLAGKNERSGAVVAMTSAIAILVIYQVLSHFFKALGMQGFIHPFLGGAGTTIIFLFYGLYSISDFSITSLFKKKI